MTELIESLRTLRRPRLLIRAARHGAGEYRRDRDLKRLIRAENLPGPSRTVPRLMSMEAEMEETRRSGDASYSIMRHVDVLIALMAEAQLLV